MAGPPTIGLCASCRHARVLESRYGSRFWFCLRSRADPTFPRYPRLPVLACRGFERRPASADTPDDPRSL